MLRDILESDSPQRIRSSFSGYDLIVIDEAQKIERVGSGLKLLVDHLPDVPVFASGSSSFELSNRLGEPLTGRQRVITLFPFAVMELKEIFGPMKVIEMLPELLIYGGYPEVLTSIQIAQKKEYLIGLRDSLLFKDILELENIRNSRKLSDLLMLIAFQIGKEVSLNELSGSLGIAKQTVERYLDLLEKTFIIKKVRGFSRNLRKEITKSSRYYFWDNGIRNALIERIKKQHYHRIYANNYFWRTYDHKEIDLVEERDGNLYGYEFKWSDRRNKVPGLWLDTYSNATFQFITRDNFLDFVT